LVGEGTGVAALGEQGRVDLPAGGLGTGLGAQVAATAGRRVGTGTGVADPAPTERGLAAALDGAAAAAGAVGEAEGAAVPGEMGVAVG
jgi:hypothetical protein